MELTKRDKELIINQNLIRIYGQIYDLTIAKTVNDRVGETEQAKKIVEQLIKAEKIKIEYEKLLKEVQDELEKVDKK